MPSSIRRSPTREASLAALAASVLAGALLVSACGGSDTPSGPTPPPVTTPTIAAVSPASGASLGGTDITITGTNFGVGAAVSVGGVATTNVRVNSTTSLSAVTGPHAAGTADVVVTVNGASATLPGGFTYVVVPPNSRPVITALTIQGTRTNEPANFADVNEEVVLTATVTDVETPVNQLTYDWSADLGTITSSSGATARWRAPASIAAPVTATITLRVTEVVATVAGFGGPSVITQTTVGSATASVHDSVKEITDLSYQFLTDFSNSSLAPDYVVRNFYGGCSGKADELGDVQKNRTYYYINSSKVATGFPVTVAFGGKCPLNSQKGDACAQVPVEWHSTCKTTFVECTAGLTYTTIGTDQTTMVYRENKWWLCASDFTGTSNTPVWAPPFIR